MMKECAYCGSIEKLTREHVVNAAFLDRFYKVGKGYANDKKRYTIDYSVIKDVCAKCNNEILGKLDDYFLNFYEKNLPNSEIGLSSSIKITYDYNNLSRWLLKTLFNSERKNGYEELPIKMNRLKDFIIGRTAETGVRIYLELLNDIPSIEIKKYFDNSDSDVPLKLNFLRLGTSAFTREVEKEEILHTMKYFISSNFMFHVFIPEPCQQTDKYFEGWLKYYKEVNQIDNLHSINPQTVTLELKPSGRIILFMIERGYEGQKTVIERMKEEHNKSKELNK